jgi:cytosine/adenosine deaminase-related metal-dependent hydrolase
LIQRVAQQQLNSQSLHRAMAWILLRNGTVLTHEGDNVVVLREHDILVKGNIIKAIGKDLAPRDHEGRVIDCTGKIISPGFIDTHHHLWQTQVKYFPQNWEYLLTSHS